MSYYVSDDNTITLTRGDTFSAKVSITNSDGTAYQPMIGDKIRFAMKKSVRDNDPILVKDIPVNTMMLVLEPNDTKQLEFRTYIYDLELTKATGEVDTFVTLAKIIITGEVH